MIKSLSLLSLRYMHKGMITLGMLHEDTAGGETKPRSDQILDPAEKSVESETCATGI
jgi:hypothetical protein